MLEIWETNLMSGKTFAKIEQPFGYVGSQFRLPKRLHNNRQSEMKLPVQHWSGKRKTYGEDSFPDNLGFLLFPFHLQTRLHILEKYQIIIS